MVADNFKYFKGYRNSHVGNHASQLLMFFFFIESFPKEVMKTEHRYSKTARENQKADNNRQIDEHEQSTSFHTHIKDDSVEITKCSSMMEKMDNSCQAEENNVVKLSFSLQDDKHSDQSHPTISKCQIQSENNLIGSVLFCSEGCFQQRSENKVGC